MTYFEPRNALTRANSLPQFSERLNTPLTLNKSRSSSAKSAEPHKITKTDRK